MSEFLLEIIAPEKHFFKGMVEQIICQTEEGELGILKDHQTMVKLKSRQTASGKVPLSPKVLWRSEMTRLLSSHNAVNGQRRLTVSVPKSPAAAHSTK